jgi:hypothetical protein
MAVEWWLVALLAAAPLALIAGLSRFRGPAAVPLADAPELFRAAVRTGRVRVALAATVVALLAGASALTARPADALGDFVGEDGETVVVLDVSSSIDDLVFREIANTLRGVLGSAGTSGRVGLVLFSDVAQEALPPGTPAVELEPFIRYFEPLREQGVRVRPTAYGAAGLGAPLPTARYPINPWFGRFSGGTQISTGLAAARRALERDADGAGRVLLVSDLQNAEEDQGKLIQELLAFSRNPSIDLRVVALPPATHAEVALFGRLVGEQRAVVSSLDLERRSASGDVLGAGFPGWLAGVVALLAIALGAGELIVSPLTWRRSRPAAGAP